MNRREVIAGLMVVATATSASAQSARRVFRIALPITTLKATDREGLARDPFYGPFCKELERLGWVEGQNLKLEWWSTEGDFARFAAMSAQVVESKPDLIAVSSNDFAVELAKATATIPIVAILGDPIAAGFAKSLARPGGNVTGTTIPGWETLGKRLELLREIIPRARKVGYFGPKVRAGGQEITYLKEAASHLGLEMLEAYLDSPVSEAGYAQAFAALRAQGVEVLLPSGGSENFNNYPTMIKLAEAARLPVMFGADRAMRQGGLMSLAFGTPQESGLVIAGYVDRILKGEKPGELPFQRPAVTSLKFSLKAAKAIGFTFPESVLVRADEVIE